MVTFDQVSKIYERGGDTITGLDRVTVEVAKGDFCAFIGPSGCGKSVATPSPGSIGSRSKCRRETSVRLSVPADAGRVRC